MKVFYLVEVQISDYVTKTARFSMYSSAVDYVTNMYDLFPVKDVRILTVKSNIDI